LSVIELDVLDEQSALDAVARIEREAGGLDVVVHNAAHLFVGITEAFDAEEVLRALEGILKPGCGVVWRRRSRMWIFERVAPQMR
jgi:NAD(P)-dependent dehydrogenase (short-subunit alcohol dehydrogenase family)